MRRGQASILIIVLIALGALIVVTASPNFSLTGLSSFQVTPEEQPEETPTAELTFVPEQQFNTAETNITECSTIDASGTYILQNDLTNDTTCFTITASDVTLDCAGYNITNTNGADGIAGVLLSNVTNVTVENCVFNDFPYSIFIGMSSANEFVNNTFTGSWQAVALFAIRGPGGPDIYPSDNNTIDGNIFYSDKQDVFVLSSSGNNITNNNMTDFGNPNPHAYNYGTIEDPTTGWTYGLIETDSSIGMMAGIGIIPANNTIDSNNASNAYYDDGYYSGSFFAGMGTDTVITNNIFENVGTGMTFIGAGANSSIITNNSCNNGSYGIRMIGTSSNYVIENNTANNNVYDGFYIDSNGGTLTNNTANNNGQHGLYGSGDAQNNTLCANGISDIMTTDTALADNNTCDRLVNVTDHPITWTSYPCAIACPINTITECQTINQSGVYYLADNITGSGSGDCLDIQVGNLKLDCEGQSITGSGLGTGIKITLLFDDIINCTVTNWSTGINLNYTWETNVLNSNISLNQYGINLTSQAFDTNINNNSIYDNTYGDIQNDGLIAYNFSSNYFGTANCPDEAKFSGISYPFDINPYLDDVPDVGVLTTCDRSVKATVLFAPYYNSTAPYDVEDTNFTITNTGDSNITILVSAVAVNSSESPQGMYPHNSYMALDSLQSLSFLASDIDPDEEGYLMVFPVDSDTGEAIAYNNLTGKVEFNRTYGHNGTYYMYGFRAVGDSVGIINENGSYGKLEFNGTYLEQMPTKLAASKYPLTGYGNNSARFIAMSPVLDLTRSGNAWDFIRTFTSQFLTYNVPLRQRFSTSRPIDTFLDTETCNIDTTDCVRSIFNYDVVETSQLTFFATSAGGLSALPVMGLIMTANSDNGYTQNSILYKPLSSSNFASIEIKYPLNITGPDVTPPVTTATATDYMGDSSYYTAVTLNCTDDITGCKTINFQIFSNFINTSGAYSCTETPCVTTMNWPAGPSTLNFYSEDNAWNLEAINSQNFTANTITSDTNLTDDIIGNSSNPSFNSGYAVIIGADNITLDCAGHYIIGNGADVGIYVSNKTNVTIKNCIIFNITYGIYIGASNYTNIINNTLVDNFEGIYLAPLQDPGTADIYTLTNNVITGNLLDSNMASIALRDGSYINITDNNITNTGSNPDVPYPSFDIIDLDTGWYYIELDVGAGISFFPQMGANLSNNLVDNNIIVDGVQWGLLANLCSNSTFSNNILVNNSNNGITLGGSADNNLTGNIVISNQNYGIWIDTSSDNNNLTGNIVNSNIQHGIYISQSSNNELTDNVANNNQQYGIFLDTNAGNNLTNNTVQKNGVANIQLASSTDNNLTGNAACYIAANDIYLDAGSTSNVGDNTCDVLTDDTAEGTVTCLTTCPLLPEIYLNSPDNETQINNTQEVDFSFNATSIYDVTLSCDIYLDDVLNQTNGSVANDTPTDFTIDNIPYGLHSWYIDCSDSLGENNSEVRAFSINDTISPTITIIKPPSPANSSSQNSTAVAINATIIDAASDIDTCILEFDNVNETMSKTGSGVSVLCNSSKTGLTTGGHNFTIYANETSGNLEVNGTWFFTILAPPSPPRGGAAGTSPATAGTIPSIPPGASRDVSLSFGETISFVSSGADHSIRVSGIFDSTVELVISSTPIKATFKVGDTKQFDTNANGLKDLEITLLSKTDTTVDIRIKALSEAAPTAPTAAITAPTAAKAAAYTSPTALFFSQKGSLLTLAIIIIVAAVIYAGWKESKHEHGKIEKT
jgi:parallel beta-helix repeat protein